MPTSRWALPRTLAIALRRTVLVAAAAALAIGSLPVPTVAQEPPAVEPVLLSQSTWNGPNRPLKLKFQATNRSDEDLGDLSLVLIIQAPARARSTYELSLTADATPVILAFSYPQDGTLQPQQTRRFSITQALDDLTARSETALYPLKVQLLSGERLVTEIRTPMIFLFDPVEAPLLLAWTWELSAPLQYVPNGTFLAGPLEGDVAPGGRLATTVDTLSGLGRIPVDLSVSAALVDQLGRMADGYRIRDPGGPLRVVPVGTGGAANAEALLAQLRAVATRPATELLSLPFADASLPALLRAGLSLDASELLTKGRALVADALGRIPREDIYAPPGSDLDAGTLAALARSGVETVVVGAGYVPPAEGQNLSSSPVVRLVAGPTEANAVRADDAAQRVARQSSDPRLAAHAALGELAAIWLERPGTTGRGVSLLLPGRMSPAPLSVFARLVRGSPWLDPVIASRLPSLVTAGGRRAVPNHRSPDLDGDYVEALLRARSSLNQFGRAVPEATDLLDELRKRLQTALGATFMRDPDLGERFIGSVRGMIRRTYSKVRIDPTGVTLASRTGFIPVTIENRTGLPVQMTVRLITDRRLELTNGNSRRLLIPAGTRTFTFPARAQTTGRFPIKIQVRTPVDAAIAETIAETQIVVRSTAYNRVALFVTVGAAVFLLMWWGRRFVPRRKTQES